MALTTYNNNDNRPSVNTYTPISFANGSSSIMGTRLSISYFNRVMQISIARKNGSNGEYDTYDNDNAVKVFISSFKAKNLYEMILKMKEDNSINNVCVETKNGLLKVSNGVEYGSTSYCVAILRNIDGNIDETIYQFKESDKGYYNYSDGNFSTLDLPDIELNTFMMTLDQYWLASSYAIAASINESNMYRQKGLRDLVAAIGKKVGVTSNSSGNNRTFLQGNGQSSNTTMTNNNSVDGAEYSVSTFDDIVSSMN